MSNFLQQKHPLILASASKIRAELLNKLGLTFSVIPSQCDEHYIKKHYGSADINALGFALATNKALDVSKQYPNQFVIGADQLCTINNKILDKPISHDIAVQHLHLLSGTTHQQIVYLCIAYNNEIIWQEYDVASLTLHQLSDECIESYLQTEQPYASCGAYHFETQGKWLFKEIRGQEDTILGLPLMLLTNALRTLKIVTL